MAWDDGLLRFTLTFTAGLLAAFSSAEPAPTPDPAKWKLVWQDEFNQDGLPDPKKWDYDIGFIANRELQYYTKRELNARIRNGALVIEARKETYPNAAYDPKETDEDKAYQRMWREAEYTSARLVTRDLAEWQYGRFEVRAKIPTGRGLWPAIWMLGHDIDKVGWPEVGELDIMENVGFDPEVVHANIHTKSYNHLINTNKGNKITLDKPYDKYHVYSMEWNQQKIEFFIDDRSYFTYENEGTGTDVWPFDKPFYMILNVAVGGGWGGLEGVDASIFPRKMLVDYVRVYQQVK